MKKGLICFLAAVSMLGLTACAIDSQGFYVSKEEAQENAASAKPDTVEMESAPAAMESSQQEMPAQENEATPGPSGQTGPSGQRTDVSGDHSYVRHIQRRAEQENGGALQEGPFAQMDSVQADTAAQYDAFAQQGEDSVQLDSAAQMYASAQQGEGSLLPGEDSVQDARAFENGASWDGIDYPAELSDEEIINCIVDDFLLMTNVPRPSHHEEKIRDFLMNWAAKQGFDPVSDEAGNVMFDIPATPGMENRSLCILQGHMDMVVAVEDGKEFDPLNDTIDVIWHKKSNTITADGTSLGADDGVGCAFIMAVAEGKMAHGPVRALITVDEEDGMEGAFSLDPFWLAGASWLINIDNEASDEVLVSTAAGDSVRAFTAAEYMDPAGDLALSITLAGLRGGHSGVEIDKGRLNAMIGLAGFLKSLDRAGITWEMSSFEGGTAPNAIPARASCGIVIDSHDREIVGQLADIYFGNLQEQFAGIEDGIAWTMTKEDRLPRVISSVQKENVVRFITEVIDGVYTWSGDKEGLVESSSNLGLFSVGPEGISGSTYMRSSSAALEDEIMDAQITLAEACGYSTERVKMADAWPYDPDSRLMALTQEVYREQNGRDIEIVAIHAGLECGTFKAMRPELEMISIGPDLADAHTVSETLFLDSVPKVWRLLEGLLARIG